MMFIQKDRQFVNLALVKKFEINENRITFYFDLERDDYTEFVFENNKKAEHYLNTTILPLLIRNLPR